MRKTLDVKKEPQNSNSQREKLYCPFCKQTNIFSPFGLVPRKKAQCPVCYSLERHRFLYFVYNDLFLKTKKNIKVMQMAPEKCIYDLLGNFAQIDYVAIDLYPENYPNLNVQKADVTKMPFEDESFDVILSNHVMEHIEDEEKFQLEMKRVLKSDGKIILTVPYKADLAKTLEDPNIKTSEDRLKHYGQADHVRQYGMDVFDRLGKHFSVEYRQEDHPYVVNDCFILTKKI